MPLANKQVMRAGKATAASRRVTTKALSNVNLVVGGATMASLALGRFVFLPFHRSSLAKAGMPKQNGQTHFEAGDRLAEEVTFFTNTNDPAGFSLVDVFAWGALGHAAAFYILVCVLKMQHYLGFYSFGTHARTCW